MFMSQSEREMRYTQKLENRLLEPIELKNLLKIENPHGQFLLNMAQQCTEFDQECRPNSHTLWKWTEKFE